MFPCCTIFEDILDSFFILAMPWGRFMVFDKKSQLKQYSSIEDWHTEYMRLAQYMRLYNPHSLYERLQKLMKMKPYCEA